MAQPLHKHDCDNCEFLGIINGKDAYYCPTGGTFILRHSSEGSDYSSRSGEMDLWLSSVDKRIRFIEAMAAYIAFSMRGE
jgi:hypothetical protein